MARQERYSRAAPGLALLVGAARSGTTLARLVLDAHPEIGCPSEAGLPGLMRHMLQVWATVNADVIGDSERRDPGHAPKNGDAPTRWDQAANAEDDDGEQVARASRDALELPIGAREWVVPTIEEVMGEYCARGGKRMYCDKSLDSVHHLPLVRELFPDVRVVLLFRHVMDTVASGIEASPWGFQAYGYAPYVQASPGNTVAALASYWLDHVSEALSWEKQYPEICHRVRYEDLVVAPEDTVTAIQRFLGVRVDLSVLVAAFEREPPRGPGDYKVEYTTSVHAASIGHGKRVPVTVLPPPLVSALNEQLEALDYEPLDRAWNIAERMVDGAGRGIWADRLVELMAQVAVGPVHDDLGSFAVVAEDHRPLRWVIDPDAGTVGQGDGEVKSVITGTAEDLVLMLTGEENLGVLLRSGRVRHVVPDEEQGRREPRRELNAIVQVLCGPLNEARSDEVITQP